MFSLFQGVSSAEDRERVAETIAHELAHQWFGDLVTMKVNSYLNHY